MMSEAMFKLILSEPLEPPAVQVYQDFYKLTEAPFAITPDPEFLFSASSHQQVLDKIGYVIDGYMGFVLLTGEVGTGKTTICRALLDRLSGRAQTVYVINPSVSGQELLANILEDMGMAPVSQGGKKSLIDQLNGHLLSTNPDTPFVVIIDDAQTMSPEALEDLRLLSNLETDKRKLIQVVLSGQPELLDKLADERLRQLKQRIAVHCRLEPLSTHETTGYISRRLSVAGNRGQVSFSNTATRLIHKRSGGIPRLINKLCDFSLTAGYVKDAQIIEPSHVKRALSELDNLDFRPYSKSGRFLHYGWASAVLLLVVISAVFFTLHTDTFGPEKTIAAPPPAIDENSTISAASLTVAAAPSQTRSTEITAGRSAETGISDPVTAIEATEGREKTQVGAQAAPYALQLGSFRTLARAERSAAQHREEGVPAIWQMLEKGQWYRIITGKFNSLQQASRYKRDHGLHDALIIRAPWSVKVLPRQPDLSPGDMIQLLKKIGCDGLMESGPAGDNEIYCGLFVSMEDASSTAERINNNDRLLAQVVSRKTAQRLLN